MGFFHSVFATSCDWKISMLGWTFTLFFVFLGSSAAVFGHWLETAGPRRAGLVSALCWCGGLLISAAGIYLHQIWMLWLGPGVIGGIGLGLGYISPVSTLIKWFPDRRGMATGLAIMGFGGGAMIGAPLADKLKAHFATQTSVGVWETFVSLAAIYFVFMVCGAFGYRVPSDGWRPRGWTPPATAANAMVTTRHVHLDVAWKTPQFWLLWAVPCLNVSAGIGVLGMSSPMLQEVFGGRLLGQDVGFDNLDAAQRDQIAAIAAGFTGLLSLCNIGGRIGWGTASDKLGRKRTYMVFFVLGFFLYAAAPWAAHAGSVSIFVLFFCVILSMYGGGFSTIPAYLADMFGTHMVGAIHGRVLTAWSTAGVLGPVLVNYIREYQLAAGVPRVAAYDRTMYILAGLLLAGLASNLLVRPVAERFFLSDEEVAAEKKISVAQVVKEEEADIHADFEDFVEEGRESGTPVPSAPGARRVRRTPAGATSPPLTAGTASIVVLIAAWTVVGGPLAWGVWMTLQKAAAFFH
jgi:MFS family permease